MPWNPPVLITSQPSECGYLLYSFPVNRQQHVGNCEKHVSMTSLEIGVWELQQKKQLPGLLLQL